MPVEKVGDVYRLKPMSLDDLSDECIRHMTETDLEILLYYRNSPIDAWVVMEEWRLGERWNQLHGHV